MDFKNFVCWDIRRVRQVMNTNAELASRDIFLAVHSDYPLTASNIRGPSVQTSTQWTITPHDFLRLFLSEDRPHLQVAVLGDSGSGKSHFIRWLELNVPATERRYVISIPRAGISLRGIIEVVLRVLPEEESLPYRERLTQAGDYGSTPQQMEERLLSAIALAIGEDRPSEEGDPDLEPDLIAGLPNIFHDPHLRNHFRQPGGVIAQLANQVLSSSTEYLPTEDRREFTVADIPLTGVEIGKMSEEARSICDFLRIAPEAQSVAVDIINRNLNGAIGHVLNFTGDRLNELLSDVRRHLRTRGQELVLLVEDLARLQGLDLSLLEALIEEGSSTNGLCTLRWAAAVTTGYYSRIPDTVKTRMNWVLNMDLSTNDDDTKLGQKAVVAFSAKYLNAVRLSSRELQSWAALPDEARDEPPSACDSCPHRQACHATFGDVDGVGLYPFNRDSLFNMLRRVDAQANVRFSPRVLVKDVMAEVLGTYGPDFQGSRFPSAQLLSQMGGRQLPPIVAEQLRSQDQSTAERQLALLELWGNTDGAVSDLPAELYAAFELSKPTLEAAQRADSDSRSSTPEAPPVRPGTDRRIEAIRAWGNGGRMQDDLLNYIRPMVFDAITSRIDWDNESLVQGFFSRASGGAFRRDSIFFDGQLTQRRRRAVNLAIPAVSGQNERTQAAIALEGLYLFGQHGDWTFSNGQRLMVTLANCLDGWCADVVDQMKNLQQSSETWDPTSAAIEMLAVGAALAGRPASASASVSECVDALFEEWPNEISAQSPEWRRLYDSVHKQQSLLKDLALATSSGTKGGQRGGFIDPGKVLPTFRRCRRRWNLTQNPPTGIASQGDEYSQLADVYRRVASELERVASAEWRLRTDWLADWYKVVPEDASRKQIVDSVRNLLELAIGNGIGFSARAMSSMDSALSSLETVQLDEAVKVASSFVGVEEPITKLTDLGRNRGGNSRDAVREFLPAVDELVKQLEASVEAGIANIGQGDLATRERKSQINEALLRLSSDLNAIGRLDVNAD